jgi:hypothetical protein
MTAVKNDDSQLTFEKIPTHTDKLRVSEMVYYVQEHEGIILQEFAGIYLCDLNSNTPPVKILDYPGLKKLCPNPINPPNATQVDSYTFSWINIISFSVQIIRGFRDWNKYIPRDIVFKDVELCMFCCRATMNSRGYTHTLSGPDYYKYVQDLSYDRGTLNRISSGPHNYTYVQDLRGGSNNQLVVKDALANTKEIQYNKVRNNEPVLPVTEDQLYVYLNSPTEPTTLEIIDSLTLNEVSTQLKEFSKGEEESFPIHHLDSVNDPGCPSYNKIPSKCISKKEYKKQALIFHPNRNLKCVQSANAKFQYLSNNWKCNKSHQTHKRHSVKSKKNESMRKSNHSLKRSSKGSRGGNKSRKTKKTKK